MLLSLLLSSALAQSPHFTPELQVRPRFEAHTGREGAEGGEVGFLSQRTRLGGSLEADVLTVRVVVQDVRLWGEELDPLADANANNLDIRVASATLDLGAGTTLVVGRQQMKLNEQRLIAMANWSQNSRVFDGGRLSRKGEGYRVDLAGFMTASHIARAPDTDGVVAIARVGWAPENGVIDLLHISVSDPAMGDLFHTTGAFARGKTGLLSGRVEGYGQYGANRRAWFAGVSGTLAPDLDRSPEVTLWYDHMSGDPTPSDASNNAFNNLYAANHKFYGIIDVMRFTVGGSIDGQGLQDLALKYAMSPTEKVSTKIDGHLFMAPAPINGAVLGEEVDLTLSWKAAEGVEIGIGGAVLLRPDLEPDLWSFLQLDAKL